MAISRPFLLVLLGVVLLGATVLAVQNARETTDNDATPAAVQADPAPAPAQTQTQSAPADNLRAAFDFGQLKSGRFSAVLALGNGRATVKIDLTGAFDAGTGQGVPDFKVNGGISAGGEHAGGSFVSVGDKAYFVKGDTGWRVPAPLWAPVAEGKLSLPVHPATWMRDAKSEGTETIAGVETEHVSARVDSQAVVNDLAQAARQNGGQLPNRAAITRALKRGEVNLWVGSEDHILRRLSLNVAFAGRGRLELDVRLGDVNKPQQIEAPAHVRAGAPGGAAGGLAQSVADGIGDLTGAETSSLKVLTGPGPRRAARAVREHKKVVIVFGNAHALDDRAMLPVIRSVDRRTKAVVLIDDVAAVERYGKLVEDVGVSQTPSIVIIDRTGHARLLEGYVDSDSLTQAVADAR
jgi:hypothetical protein